MKLVTGNPELDFFEQNPHLRDVSAFKELLKKEKKKASKIMWAIFKTEDINSPLYTMPLDERRHEVAKNYLEDSEFNWENYKSTIQAYKNLAMPKVAKMFKIWMDKLEGMTDYLDSLSYEEDDDKILKIFEKSEKIWNSYEKIEAKMIEHESKNSVFGGGEESIREKRQRG